MKRFIVAILLSFAAPTFANYWSHFREDSCRGVTFKTGLGLRQYSSDYWFDPYNVVLDPYRILICENVASATINDQYFSHPNRCSVTGAGPSVHAEFDVNDKGCSVDLNWLFEKIGNVIGKDIRCLPRTNSDGCKPCEMGVDLLHAACVVLDMCYAIPASFGITKGKCDELVSGLGHDRCIETNRQDCQMCLDSWANRPSTDFDLITYQNAQKANTTCSLTVRQRESSLYHGSVMEINSTRWSPNGRYLLTLKSDGNLIIYRKPSDKVIWSSKTQGRGVVRAIMQNDGDFVLYTKSREAIWHTNTYKKPKNHLLLQNDGNLVLYSMGAPTVQWASKINAGDVLPLSTNLRTEFLDSTSIEHIGIMTMQEALANTPEALSDTPVDIVHFDRDPNSAPDQPLIDTLDGIN
jgi:hypothetical protein